ncbi:hydrogenase maturation protease [Aquipuribacter sp. SD81]|uniref:hydrogenase maturation protease n=1 Tax=Aquipuribacter sp. SD81 TaxID=3127703 RepID=UPI00301B0AAB
MTATAHGPTAPPSDGAGGRPHVLVAALGDTEHGDEGFAAHVLRSLPRDVLPAGVEVAYYGTATDRLLADLERGWDGLVVLDALPERGCPGSLRVVDLDNRRTVTLSHDLDAPRGEAPAGTTLVDAARRLVPRTVLVGCEVVTADERVGLTGDVEACVRPAARFVLSVLGRITGTHVPEPDWLREADEAPGDDGDRDLLLTRGPLGRLR